MSTLLYGSRAEEPEDYPEPPEPSDYDSLDASCPPESPDTGPDDAALILTALDRLREQEKQQGFAGTANQFQETFHPDLIGMLWAQGA